MTEVEIVESVETEEKVIDINAPVASGIPIAEVVKTVESVASGLQKNKSFLDAVSDVDMKDVNDYVNNHKTHFGILLFVVCDVLGGVISYLLTKYTSDCSC